MVGQNIRAFRVRYDLTQKDLALIAGVSYKTVSAWETGRAEPKMGTVQKIADHFGIRKSEIIEDEVPPFSEEETKMVILYRKLRAEQKALIDNMIGQLSVSAAM